MTLAGTRNGPLVVMRPFFAHQTCDEDPLRMSEDARAVVEWLIENYLLPLLLLFIHSFANYYAYNVLLRRQRSLIKEGQVRLSATNERINHRLACVFISLSLSYSSS